MLDHSGDSYIIYEAGNRSTEYPPNTIKDLEEETEGKEADSGPNFPVDPRNLSRNDGGYPSDEDKPAEQLPMPPDTGYPNASWSKKILSRYEIKIAK